MAEYIEREAAIEFARLHYCKDCNSYNGILCGSCGFDDAILLIEDVPTAEVVEVRHGTWLDAPNNGKPVQFDARYNEGCVPQHSCYCSVCGEWLTASDEYAVIGRYCPNCGAKMDGKGEGE